jgi:hypothetical protein
MLETETQYSDDTTENKDETMAFVLWLSKELIL